MEAPVLFDELATDTGQRLGQITLNVPKTLNSLTLEMVELTLDQLARWRDDEGLVAILIRGRPRKPSRSTSRPRPRYNASARRSRSSAMRAASCFISSTLPGRT